MAGKEEKRKRLVGATGGGEYAAVSPWTLRREAYKGRITSYKIGTRLLFDLNDIDEWLDKGRRPALSTHDAA